MASIAASVRSVFSRRTGTESINESVKSDLSSDDDEEGMFIYQRVPDLPSTFFTHDALSACLIAPEVHVYATHAGIVHLREASGKVLRTVRVHRASVLDIDSDGKYIATSSIDGTVVIASLADPMDTVQASFKRPVHCVSLHPDYRNHRSYVSGGTAGEVVLSERGWLKSRADTILAHTQSTIVACTWVSAPNSTETRILWCNDEGITIYSLERRAILNRVPRAAASPQADIYRPRIHIHEGLALVAWARTLYKIDLDKGTLSSMFEVPYILSGAIPFKSLMALLTVDPQSSSAELKLRNADGVEVYADELELNTLRKAGSNEFHLFIQSEKVYIISSNDAIVARERTPRDHVEWLYQKERFAEAYSSMKSTISPTKEPAFEKSYIYSVGIKAAQQLMDSKSFTSCARILSEILEPGDNEWLLWSNQFLSVDQQLVWGSVLPNYRIGDVQNEVLIYAIEHKCTRELTDWIDNWPITVYNSQEIANKLESAAKSCSEFLSPYANLLMKMGEYVTAVQALIRADSPRVFNIVKHYHLWSEPKILDVLDSVLSAGYGEEGDGGFVERIRDIIEVRAEIPPQKVVDRLLIGDNDLLLFGYLTELGLVDETQLSDFTDLMIKLYIKFDTSKLLGFLQKFDSYDLDMTVQLCREHHLTSALVYLLGRLGQFDEALFLIVTDLKDYARATSFAANIAKTQGPEVWNNLTQYCKTEPQLVLELLKRPEISPAKVLAAVPSELKISGLKAALCSVLHEQDTSLSLSEGTLGIVSSESIYWTRALRRKRLEGNVVNPEQLKSETPPLLIDDEGVATAVPEFIRPVATFGAKIAHLKIIYGI